MSHQANQALQVKPKIINHPSQTQNHSLGSIGSLGRLKTLPISTPLKKERKKVLYHYVTGLSTVEVELLRNYLKLADAGLLDSKSS